MGSLAFVDRTVTVGRRLGGNPELPLVAATILGTLAMVEVLVRHAPPTPPESGSEVSLALLLAAATTMPLAVARAHLPAAWAIFAASMALTLAGHHPVTVATLIALAVISYRVGFVRSRRVAVAVVLPWLANAIWSPFGHGTSDRVLALFLFALVCASTAVGQARRSRMDAARRDESRQAFAESLLDHAARGERARIARELHDVVAHHISMIAVQAETARFATTGLSTDGARRLVAIGDTARTALTEMRRLLGVLREDAGPEPTRAPQPSLDQLNALIDEARASSGTSMRLIVHGGVKPLDAGVELTAYRIIQEALTNARRHAPGAAVDVELRYGADVVRIRVRDNGPGPAALASTVNGHGLVGMRERVGMVGGTLHTGPAPLGGFLVEAVLPSGEAVLATSEVS